MLFTEQKMMMMNDVVPAPKAPIHSRPTPEDDERELDIVLESERERYYYDKARAREIGMHH